MWDGLGMQIPVGGARGDARNPGERRGSPAPGSVEEGLLNSAYSL